MTLYLLKVHLQTFLSIPITQKCQIFWVVTFLSQMSDYVIFCARGQVVGNFEAPLPFTSIAFMVLWSCVWVALTYGTKVSAPLLGVWTVVLLDTLTLSHPNMCINTEYCHGQKRSKVKREKRILFCISTLCLTSHVFHWRYSTNLKSQVLKEAKRKIIC